MAKLVIWTVDDDPDVLRAGERDLRRQYGDRYKVISADSGASALETVKRLNLRKGLVAFFGIGRFRYMANSVDLFVPFVCLCYSTLCMPRMLQLISCPFV